MINIEELIDAILRGKEGKGLDGLDKMEVWTRRQALLEVLIPALPVLEEIKAQAWDEGREAYDNDPNPYRPA